VVAEIRLMIGRDKEKEDVLWHLLQHEGFASKAHDIPPESVLVTRYGSTPI